MESPHEAVMESIPPQFYRVQHNKSFTSSSSTGGFESPGHYHMSYSFWITKQKLESHLHWGACPNEPTPFISVFSDFGKLYAGLAKYICTFYIFLLTFAARADARARYLRNSNTGVFIAKIDTSLLRLQILEYEVDGRVVRLPVWEDEESGMTFISTSAVRMHLGVDSSISQVSEWFALDYILYSRIRGIEHY